MRHSLAPLVLAIAAWPASAGAEAFHKGPYLQGLSDTGAVVMWEPARSGPGRVIVRSPGEEERVFLSPSAAFHEVRLGGLTPGRRYAYTVEAGGEAAGGEFGTAPAPSEPFSFVVFGDTRSQPDAHRVMVERVRREVPDFILTTGDAVNDGSNEQDWQTFFTIERDLLRDNVLFPALGNHDRQGRARTADGFRKYFALPADSPDPERYYAFTFGNSRFLVLDSNAYSFALTDQTAWLTRELERVVADPALAHAFVVMHHPVYSTSLHGGQPQLREAWAPIFERYGVDAVFSGHDHTYERSEQGGVRYIVSGGGGAPLYPKDPRADRQDLEATVYFERTYNFIRLQVVGEFVEIAAIRDDGTLIESLSWGSLPPRPVAARERPRPQSVTVAGPVPPAPPGSGGCAVAARGAAPAAGPGPGLAALLGTLAAFLLRRRA